MGQQYSQTLWRNLFRLIASSIVHILAGQWEQAAFNAIDFILHELLHIHSEEILLLFPTF